MRSTGLFDSAYAIDAQLRREGYDPDASITLALLGWVCRGVGAGLSAAAEYCQKRHDLFVRRGRYWDEKRLNDAKAEFLRDTRALCEEPFETFSRRDFDRRYSAILTRFMTVRETINREIDARVLAEINACAAPPPWFAPRAVARRARFRARREGAWGRWAARVRAAFVRGFTPPPAPGERRRSGAPIRRLCRASVNPMPAIEDVVAAYRAARGRGHVAEKLRCGSLLLDAEAGVDSSLVRTATGEIVGRRPGLRGWIGDRAPWLLNHYVTLMKWRRLAQAFREAHGLRDPVPASVLLDDDAPAVFPQPLRGRLEAARRDAKELLASAAGRTVKDFRQTLARREWRRTG